MTGVWFRDPTGHVQCSAIADIQLLMPAKCILSLLPGETSFGKAGYYINNPSLIPDLNWSNPDQNMQNNRMGM